MLKESSRHIILGIGVIIIIIIITVVSAGCSRASGEDNRDFTIGLVSNNPNGLRNIQGFKNGLTELGYIEGENVTYVFEGAPTPGGKLDAVLKNMVEAEVDLIFTAGTPTGIAAHRLTAGTNIPVVFGVIADPIAAGVMKDLTQPGGNMTGVKLSDNQDRRLELLLEMAPYIGRVFVPYDTMDAASTSAIANINEVAPGLGVEIVEGLARNDREVTDLFKNMPEGIQAIFLVPGTTVNARLDDVLAVAFDRKLPVSGPSLVQVEEGALTTYGFNHEAAGVQAARIADQVLKGADPGDLPVETAEFFLVINLATADAIELELPDEILQQAEIIIRNNEEQ